MNNLKLRIKINKPTRTILDFTLNPENTPKWIDSIVKEETSEWPVKVGTIYRNQNTKGEWGEYTLVDLNDIGFEMKASDNNYHVRYTLTAIDENTTDFEYYEWVENGDLGDPFTQDILEKLKIIVESTE